jgi:voltage-gated potassium channel Kch
MWWAIVTLGTIGYGDAVPITLAGRLVAGLTIFVGLLMVALPVGIVAAAFANEVHRRDFVVTWGLARIPLFSELSAAQIADVMKILRRRWTRERSLSDAESRAHFMYLIVDAKSGSAAAQAYPSWRRRFLRRGRRVAAIPAIRNRRRSHVHAPVSSGRLRSSQPVG